MEPRDNLARPSKAWAKMVEGGINIAKSAIYTTRIEDIWQNLLSLGHELKTEPNPSFDKSNLRIDIGEDIMLYNYHVIIIWQQSQDLSTDITNLYAIPSAFY